MCLSCLFSLSNSYAWHKVDSRLGNAKMETLVFSGRTFYTGLYQKRTKSLKSDCIAPLVCRELYLTVSRAQRTGFLVHAFFQDPEYGL